MANRLSFLVQQIKQKSPKFVESSFDYLGLSSFLTQEENTLRLKARKLVQTEVVEKINSYVQEAKFPQYLLPKIREADILSHFIPKPYGKGSRSVLTGVICAELARGDLGVATMCIVQIGLLGYTVNLLGSEEQKQKYLPKIINLQMIGGWALTENNIGSDASNIETIVTKINQNSHKINGVKRWIGNGNRDLLVVWAKNAESKKVQAFLVQNKQHPGIKSQVIEHKLAARVVQNCQITFKDVVVQEKHRLPKAVDFQTGTNAILKHSRVFVFWIAAGVAMGVYDRTIKYASERKQFGKSISGFQLTQLKLVNMMATIQAMLLLCFRISTLVDEKKINLGQIAMAKAWITERGRQVAKWGREIFGGNGIIHDNYVMKALADMEVAYTYQGTYDINILAAGREITGLAAFVK